MKKRRKKDEERREYRIMIRFNQEEFEHIRRRAEEEERSMFLKGGINYSGFCRGLLLSETNFKNEELLRTQKRLTYEVRKIGVNINQVAKRINAGYGSYSDIKVLEERQERIEELLDANIKECERLWGSPN